MVGLNKPWEGSVKGWMMMLLCFHIFKQMFTGFVGFRVVNKADALNMHMRVHT